jgi:DNA-binding response OmpR family regulator
MTDQEEVRVVLVEDDPDVSEAVSALLQDDGYRVRTVSTAEEAMSVIAQDQPICVILDLGLPTIGGVELARRIRAAQGTGIVLIVLTGSVLASDQSAAEAAGVDYVLHKPLDVDLLRRMLPPLGC